MLSHHARLAGLAALMLAVAACEEPAVSDIPFAQVQQAAAGGDAAFKDYFPSIKGKKIAWQGQVVEARRQVEDDYITTGLLLVDLDGSGEAGGEDAQMKISANDIESFKPGQPVNLTAIVREYELRGGRLLLKLETKEVK
ncbi:MAG: hypothetical protein ACFCUQ_12945 [Kiloniellales bacterium]